MLVDLTVGSGLNLSDNNTIRKYCIFIVYIHSCVRTNLNKTQNFVLQVTESYLVFHQPHQ